MVDKFDEMSNAQLNALACQLVSWPASQSVGFTPADSMQHADTLLSAYLGSLEADKVAVNFVENVVYRQQPGWVSSHPVPQARMYHPRIIIEHVIVGGRIYEATDMSRARAETIAVLRAAGNGA